MIFLIYSILRYLDAIFAGEHQLRLYFGSLVLSLVMSHILVVSSIKWISDCAVDALFANSRKDGIFESINVLDNAAACNRASDIPSEREYEM